MKKVFVFLADGFEETEAIFPIDLLRRAGADLETVSISGTKNVTSSHGIGMTTDKLFEEINLDDAAMVFMPGGLGGYKNLLAFEPLMSKLPELNEKKVILTAICAAPAILGSLGLLANKNATCYPGFEPNMKDAVCTGAEVEVADNIITGRSAGVALDFALELVSALKGKEVSMKIANEIVV